MTHYETVPIVRLEGDIESTGAALGGGHRLTDLFDAFFAWNPIAPTTALELATLSARLCRLLRDDVTEALARRSEALTTLASDWRDLLFPSTSDEQFADGYAQAVTFGLLMARARGISVAGNLHQVSNELQPTSSLIGTALALLTDSAEARSDLSTSLPVLQRVLEVVDWDHLSRGSADAWLYFYEEFLEVYDNTLRKQTGSYYTPPQVVSAMVRLVDDVLRRPGFALTRGIAAPDVTVADPATGTGTFVLGVLRRIAAIVEADEGSGAVGPAIEAAMQRLVAFELQLGPFAVTQLPPGRRPQVPLDGAIPSDLDHMPDTIDHDASHERLRVGGGFIDNVPLAVWRYEVSGKQVLTQWFSYRRKTRERPLIGDRRPPSALGDIQPEAWPAQYTTELLNVLNVLGLLLDLEPVQAALLDRICDAALFDGSALLAAGAFASAAGVRRRARQGDTSSGTARLDGFD